MLLGGISAVASGHDGHGGGRQPSGRNETASTEPLKPAVQTPVQTVAHDGEHTLDAALFGRGVTGKSIDYVVLQRVRVRSGSTDGGTDTGADDTTSGLWLRHDDGSAPTRLAPGAIIAKADFGRVFWSAEDNAGGEFQFVASDARGVPVGGATPQIVTVQELPPVPVYPEQPVSYTVAHDQTLAIDAQALAGHEPENGPGRWRAHRRHRCQPGRRQHARPVPEGRRRDTDRRDRRHRGGTGRLRPSRLGQRPQ